MPPHHPDARTTAESQPPYSQFLGIRFISIEPDRVVAELDARPELMNRNGVLHGGAIMGFADHCGGTACYLNLPEGARTTTIESKTNFLRAIPEGEVATAVCVPLHIGRTTLVWQTTISGANGKPAAVVTQTQLVLKPSATA